MLVKKSILAGMAIGLGCWLSLAAPNPIVGALLFSCGLIIVRLFNLSLFTGKVQFFLTNKYPKWQYLIILLFNVSGIALMTLLMPQRLQAAAVASAQIKLQQSAWQVFVQSVGCGMLMTAATYRKTPLYVTILCVMSFILAGLNHCIADSFYYLVLGSFSPYWPLSILGNFLGGILLTF